MKDWKTEKSIYQIIEINKGKKEEYILMMTGNEISNYVNAKYAMADNSKYSCVAYMMN